MMKKIVQIGQSKKIKNILNKIVLNMNTLNIRFLIFSLLTIFIFYFTFYNIIVPAEDALMNFNQHQA